MLTLVLGKDWTANRARVMEMVCADVKNELGNRVLMVPELISHETERLLCVQAGASSCRFSEVLSFSRLAKRVAESAGHGAPECLDDGGRVVAMAAAVNQVQSRLKYYAALETKPEFLTELVDAVDEFKRCLISTGDLMEASKKSTGSFAQKLEELALILASYDSVCAHLKMDPRDQMTWLLEELETSDYADNHVFYVDGFPDFTRQHMAILSYLIAKSPNVTVSLNCDVPGSGLLAFEKAGETAKTLIKAAQKANVKVEIVTVQEKTSPMLAVAQGLFQGALPATVDCLHVEQYESVHRECDALAERILKLVHSGARYKDISVVCADMSKYHNILNKILGRCGIPVYIAGTDSVLEKSVIKTIVSAIDATVSGFEQSDVLRYARTMFSQLDASECDRLENYVLMWGISGRAWLETWQKHPEGLEGKKTEKSEMILKELNAIKKKLMEPLCCLRDALNKATTVENQTVALYQFMEQIQLAQRLQNFAQELDEAGDNRNAQILNQLWDILIDALEQLHDALGRTAWDKDVFSRLFKLLISQYSVGTIPTVLDAVVVGPVSAMRCQEVKHLFVLGAVEGDMPAYGSNGGILTDSERNVLRTLGVPLTGGAADGLQIAFSEIYGVFCGARESACITCPSGQPSYLFKRLEAAAHSNVSDCSALGAVLYNRVEAAAFLARYSEQKAAEQLQLDLEYIDIAGKKKFSHGLVSKENIEKLYGKKLMLSASQIDKQADCRMAYYLRYGLRAKERKPATVDPAEFGTYIHDVLEKTARDIVNKGGFHMVGKDEALQIAAEYSQSYISERFSNLDSQRINYLLQRNALELNAIVSELWEELSQSEFAPILFEMRFGGEGAEVPEIKIQGHNMDGAVRGVVDRVDVWQSGTDRYIRVVDYKTGKKDFDYCDVFNGLGLQMLLYLFALKHADIPQLKSGALPAGVQYFPARAPLIPADGRLEESEAAAECVKNSRRKGLLLRDESVLYAMEPSEKPVRIGITVNKSGKISGDLADFDQFVMLESYIYKLLGSLVDQIGSGEVAANPYTRGSSHNACWYCPYGPVCHSEEVENRRNYERMNAERFWDEVGKELKNRG